jgi:antitoxin MazE
VSACRRWWRAARLSVDQRVRVSLEWRQVVITSVADATPTLEWRLAQFDPARHGGEAMLSEWIGAGRW